MSDAIPTGFKLLSAEAAESQIQQIVGMSYEIFTNTVVFAQATSKSTAKNFIECTDAEQKDLFRTMFNLQAYDDALALVEPDSKAIATQLELSKNRIQLIAVRREGEDTLISTLREALERFEAEKKLTVATKEHRVSEINKQLKDLDWEAIQSACRTAESEYQATLGVVSLADASLQKASLAHTQAVVHYKVTCDSLATREKELLSLEIPTLPEPPEEPSALMERRSQLQLDVQELRQHLTGLDKENSAKTAELEALKGQVVEKQKLLAICKSRVQEANEQLAKAKKRLEDVSDCPLCKQAFSKSEHKKHATKELQSEVDLALAKVAPAEAAAAKVEAEVAALQASVDACVVPEIDPTLRKDVTDAIAANMKELLDIEAFLQSYGTAKSAYALQKQRVDTIKAKRTVVEEEVARIKLEEPIAKAKIAPAATAKEKAEADARSALQGRELAEAKLLKAKEGATAVQPLLDELKRTAADIASAQASTFPDAGKIEEAEKRACQLKTEQADLIAAEQQLEMDAHRLGILKHAFGNEGIVSELFREYIPSIQAAANEYLCLLTNNELELVFEAEKQLKSKPGEVRNKFSLEARKRNGGEGYDLLSGSEQRKIALVCSWALSDVAQQYSNISTNLRVFDEVFDSLGATSTERLAMFLAQHNFGRTTFIISHKTELIDIFTNKICLERRDGVTRILNA